MSIAMKIIKDMSESRTRLRIQGINPTLRYSAISCRASKRKCSKFSSLKNLFLELRPLDKKIKKKKRDSTDRLTDW